MSGNKDELISKKPSKKKAKIRIFAGTFTGGDTNAMAFDYLNGCADYFRAQMKLVLTYIRGVDDPALAKAAREEHDALHMQYNELRAWNSPEPVKLMDKLVADVEELVESTRKNAEKCAEADKQQMVGAIGAEQFAKRLTATQEQINSLGARVEGLNPAEIVAIRTYTLATSGEGEHDPNKEEEFRDINRLYRNDGRIARNSTEPPEVIVGDPEKVRTKIRMLEKAMKKLPNYHSDSGTQRLDVYSQHLPGPDDEPKWAGWPAIHDRLASGGDYVVDSFWSTGKSGTINSSAPQRVYWTVYGGSGKDIDALSAMKGEGGGEVLYPPGTKFKVHGIRFEEDQFQRIWRLTIEEIVS